MVQAHQDIGAGNILPSSIIHRPSVVLDFRELADVYALRTLYDFLTADSAPYDVVFQWGEEGHERAKAVLKNCRRASKSELADVVISVISDVSKPPREKKTLSIDIAILKNSVQPLTEQEKLELRAKYGIVSERPILVVGYADDSQKMNALSREVGEHAEVYLVGDPILKDLPSEINAHVHVVNKWGILKDYYAMADVAINGRNLRESSATLHNFVEATEGGPLFMVRPGNTAQYGYKQLVAAGVIREFAEFDELVKALKAELAGGARSKIQSSEARAKHLQRTRAAYSHGLK